MMKSLLCVLMLLAVCVFALALPLQESVILDAAEGFVASWDGAFTVDHLSNSNSRDADDNPLYYIAQLKPQGFLLIANNRAAVPILAWSQEADFPLDNIPDNLKWYLDSISEQLAYLAENTDSYTHPEWNAILAGDYSRYNSSRSVSPLLQTTWNQNYPYNASCPADAGGPGGRAYAGCVATAMAQVMKYWSYPASGSGSYSYSSSYGTLSADFANSTFNWSAMPNSISSSNTAVADLIYKCGISCHMTYSASGSFASGVNALHGAIANFGYNPEANSYYKDNYALATWNNMLQTELEQGHPIGYSGGTGYSAHAFVMDGFMATDYYHINWGWGGYYNGYFYLNNLSPAGGYNYTANQAALLGVYPAVNKPANFQASVSRSSVNLGWNAPPVTDFNADWKAWGGSREYAGFGFDEAVTFETAIRFPVSSLTPYQNRYLKRVRFIANDSTCSYALKVYTGGNSSAPGSVVRNQAINSFIPKSWNTVELTEPLLITGAQEIWISLMVTQNAAGYPISIDYGPRVQDQGNKIKIASNAWTTLYALNSSYDYNWTMIAGFSPVATREDDRSLTGYQIWRFTEAQINQPDAWTLLTPASINTLSYSDPAWYQLGSGTYYWAIKAIHTQGIMSAAALSNSLVKLSAPEPISITYTSSNNRITLAWPAVSGAAHYKIYSSATPYGTYELVHTTSQTSWFTTSMQSVARLFYKVVAVSP